MNERKTPLEAGVAGVILISGPFGSGKSTAGLGIAHPSQCVFIDLDAAKTESRAASLGIPYYAPQGEGLSDPLDFNLGKLSGWIKETFADIRAKHSGRTAIVIDNGTGLEDVFSYLVRNEPARYGVNPTHAQSGSYGGVNPGVGRLWENTIRFLRGVGFKQVVITMHMSAMWAGGAPVDKYKVKGNKVLSQFANLAIVLLRADTPNTPPAALVGKEALALSAWDEGAGELRTFMALPPRVPVFTWPRVVAHIEAMKAGKSRFEPDEIPSRQEADRYGPWLSDEQKALIAAVAKNPNFAVSEEEGERPAEPEPQPAAKPEPAPAGNLRSAGRTQAKATTETNTAAEAVLRSNGTPRLAQAGVKAKGWTKRATELAAKEVYYTKNGQVDWLHLTKAAAKLGYQTITDDNLEEVLDCLRSHAAEQRARRESEPAGPDVQPDALDEYFPRDDPPVDPAAPVPDADGVGF